MLRICLENLFIPFTGRTGHKREPERQICTISERLRLKYTTVSGGKVKQRKKVQNQITEKKNQIRIHTK